MAIKKITLNLNDEYELSSFEKKQLDNARNSNITFDEDCPELSAKQLAKMAEAAKARKRSKQVLALRISFETYEKAKAVGKGYTGFLSRLLDLAINDPELVKKALNLR